MRWFTSDHHFGHQNIIEYCDRPFQSVDHMNRFMINSWNEVVQPEDSVFVIGDFAMGKIAETLPLAKQLQGRKSLICGNHDRPWKGNIGSKPSDMDKHFKWAGEYMKNGFNIVSSGSVQIELGGRHDVIMNHFPPEGDSGDEDRYLDWRPREYGQVILHGHIHSKDRGQGNLVHVGVDAWDFAPASEDDICDIIDSRKESGEIEDV